MKNVIIECFVEGSYFLLNRLRPKGIKFTIQMGFRNRKKHNHSELDNDKSLFILMEYTSENEL